VPVRSAAVRSNLNELPQVQAAERRAARLRDRGYCPPCSRAIGTLGWSGLPRLCHACTLLAERESMARQKDASP
jgi:hypothetical protein